MPEAMSQNLRWIDLSKVNNEMIALSNIMTIRSDGARISGLEKVGEPVGETS